MANTDGRATGIHDVASGKLLANRWRVLDTIGSGGMGVVYRCWDLNLKTTVAVKILNQEFQDDQRIVERFHREVEVLIKSAHPNIAVIHACSSRTEEPPVFLVMEFLDGPTLKMLLDDSPGRRLHPQRILRIGTQVLDALDAVHERGVIHRDLKPENVFVLRTGTGRRNIDVAKVIDFGIAKANESQNGSENGASLTQVGTVVGTPYYMSPEQCLGAAFTDHRADLYAVGVMLYEMATGQLPFDKPTREEIMTAHIAEMPDMPRMLNPDISPELETVIAKAMAKKASLRFANALEMSEALEEAIPEDKTYYRDSQRVSPVAGRALATPPRVPVVASPEAEREGTPPTNVSATPTKPLKAPGDQAADIGLAKTVTPHDLDQEARALAEAIAVEEALSGEAKPEEAEREIVPNGNSAPTKLDVRHFLAIAAEYAKQCGVWIGKVPRQARIWIAAGVLTTILLVVLAKTLSYDSGERRTADAVRNDDATTVAEVAPVEIPNTAVNSPDAETEVAVTQIPVPVPVNETDAGISEETDAGSETDAEAPEVSAEAELPATPPSGYAELIGMAHRARNWRTAAAKLEEATRLWPEGPDAWEELGDLLVTERGQTGRARNAYTRCLELLPPNALVRRAAVEGKLQGLR